MHTAFLFPGQGSQYVGMGAVLYRASTEARLLFEQANRQLGYDLTELCFAGPPALLNDTQFTQPAVFVTDLAFWSAVQQQVPAPAYVAGHSLGEFAALVASGAVEFTAALALVAARGQWMADCGARTPGGMAVLLGATLADATALCTAVTEVCGAPLVVANDNCPGQVVISGTQRALQQAAAMHQAYGVRRMQPLPISVAPHSPLMSGPETEFTRLLAALPLRSPQIRLVMNVPAQSVHEPEAIRAALLAQLTAPVRWRESLLWLFAQGVTHFVEVGPKAILAGLVKRTLKDATVESVDAVAEGAIG